MVGSIKWTCLLCLGAAAQAVIAQETNVLRVNTRLVEVDVVVHSKGAAVADLQQDDFTVLDNGKPQKVAAFNIISSRSSRADPVPLPAGTVSNRLTVRDQVPAGATIVLFDTLNTAVADGLAYRKFKARLHDLGVVVNPMTAAEFASYIATETEKWTKVVKFADIKPE